MPSIKIRVSIDNLFEFGINTTKLEFKGYKRPCGYYLEDRFMAKKFEPAVYKLMVESFTEEGKWEKMKRQMQTALKNIKLENAQRKKTS